MSSDGYRSGVKRPHALRYILHLIVCAAAWVLFVRWWQLVIEDVTSAEVQQTVLFVAIAIVVTVVGTILWVAHNVRIARKKPRRTSSITLREVLQNDTLGRPVRHAPDVPSLRKAQHVRLAVDPGGVKVYEVGGSAPAPGGRREPVRG